MKNTKFNDATILMLNLRMFDTVTNATTSVGDGNDLSPEMKTYYSKYLIDNAEPELVHDQFAQKRNIPKNGGKTIEFRRYSPLPKAMTPLTEGATPDGQALHVTAITSELKQYGGWVLLTDVLELTAIDNNIVEATKMIGSQAGRTLDSVTREIISAGTNVIYAGGTVTARANVSGEMKLAVKDVFNAARALKAQNAKKIDGSYVAIIHPNVAYDLMTSEDWLDVNKYTNANTKIFEGEIGKIGGVRFVETTEAKVFEGAGASSADVYSTLVIAENAYATTSVDGGGLEHIVKQRGSAGTADPLNQRSSVGWKALKTAEILSQEYMVRIESGASY